MEKMKSYWVWHWRDYEVYHTMMVHLRRQDQGIDFPAFWHLATPYVNVEFLKEFTCDKRGYMKAFASGSGYCLYKDRKYPLGEEIILEPGEHTVKVIVYKTDGLPAMFIESDICPSDATWLCNRRAGKHEPVGLEEYYDSIDKDPEVFPFSYERRHPVKCEQTDDGMFYDFGTELFGYLNITYPHSNETLGVFYGESAEEANDGEEAILFEYVSGSTEYRLVQRAFRFIKINCKDPSALEVTMDYEFLPYTRKGDFHCDNDLFNRIYDMSVHTFHLNCREGFFDGIKRDRWIWSGDAYQSTKINNYLFADAAIAKRTSMGLIGKEPFEQHINTIIDYSLYWIISLYEHYMYYGDPEYLERIYPMALKLMEFCEKRLDEHGFIVGIDGDWTFIDWSDIDKTGAVCAEQMLLIESYRALANIADVIGECSACFREKAEKLRENVNIFFWNDELGAFIDSFESGLNNVTRHANIFAVMYDIATPEQIESIRENVLKNDNITKITTPYFEAYELDVLCKLGEFDIVEKTIDSYWGGMLAEGATTIWEEYIPELKGAEHYEKYGKKYGKSLCHAWGAGPVYLFGRYYLGVYPTSPAYETFNVEPHFGGLNEFSGKAPIGDGTVEVSLNKEKISVKADKNGGTLIWNNKAYTIKAGEELVIFIK
ncbi:MAG: alpha-rhamnosidase [Ruminococcaceae bacterium]|nr:alpha-rhamnosidase [Oscillospiraceae bacterium]